MSKPKAHIIKSYATDEKCSFCDKKLTDGEKCLSIFKYTTKYTKKGENYQSVKIHICCINPFFKYIKKIKKENLIKNL